MVVVVVEVVVVVVVVCGERVWGGEWFVVLRCVVCGVAVCGVWCVVCGVWCVVWCVACLGISLVRVGGSAILALKPKKAPTKTRGVLMPNHMRSSASIVPTGMAPEEACPQMKK